MPTLTLTMPDGEAEAYLATAPGGAPAPGVLFVIDAIGLRPRIEEMADRIASWGYTVLAPNVSTATAPRPSWLPARTCGSPVPARPSCPAPWSASRGSPPTS